MDGVLFHHPEQFSKWFARFEKGGVGERLWALIIDEGDLARLLRDRRTPYRRGARGPRSGAEFRSRGSDARGRAMSSRWEISGKADPSNGRAGFLCAVFERA